jgi:hypothetical protein
MRAAARLALISSLFATGCAQQERTEEPASVVIRTNRAETSRDEPQLVPPPLPSDVGDIEGIDTLRDPFEQLSPPAICTLREHRLRERGERVAFAEVPITRLRVRGTATGVSPSAIVEDGGGQSRVLRVGDRVGPAMIDARGNLTEWEVDRVRNGNVVLVETGAVAGPLKTHVLAGSS